MNGTIVTKNWPTQPSGVQLAIAIVPPGRVTRTSSSATAWWFQANIAPNDESTVSNDASANGSAAASASPHSSAAPRAVAPPPPRCAARGERARAPGPQQLRREVGGDDVAAGQRGRDGGRP